MTRQRPIPHPCETSSFDAVVVGAGFAGLATAMRLGAGGWRVAVVDRLDHPGGQACTITRNGHRFDLGPTLLIDPDEMRRLFLECGEDPETAYRLHSSSPVISIRWGDGSMLDIDAGSAVGADGGPDADGWKDLVWDTARAPRGLMRRIARHLPDERLHMAAALPALLLGMDPARAAPALALPQAMRRGMTGAEGGIGQLALAMAEVVRRRGGTLRMRSEVAELVTDDRREVTGVRLAGGETLAAPRVIVTGHQVPPRAEARRGTVGLFVWHFGTTGTRDVWPDLGEHVMIADGSLPRMLREIRRGEIPSRSMLHLHRATSVDPTAAASGDDTFYALVPVPSQPAGGWDDIAEPLRQRIEDRLSREIMPGLGSRIAASLCLTPEDVRTRTVGRTTFPASPWRRFLGPRGLHNLPSLPGEGVPGALRAAEALVRDLPARTA